jgi:hypothetical protein
MTPSTYSYPSYACGQWRQILQGSEGHLLVGLEGANGVLIILSFP